MTDLIENLNKQLDDFGAAHIEMTTTDEQDQPTFFILVSKDTQTIDDIKKIMSAYDNGDKTITL